MTPDQITEKLDYFDRMLTRFDELGPDERDQLAILQVRAIVAVARSIQSLVPAAPDAIHRPCSPSRDPQSRYYRR